MGKTWSVLDSPKNFILMCRKMDFFPNYEYTEISPMVSFE